MTIYYLHGHVYACLSSGEIIFLDAKQDNYYTLPFDESRYLRPLTRDRYLIVNDIATQNEQEDARKKVVIKHLLDSGLLSTQKPEMPDFQIPKYLKTHSDCSRAHFEVFHSVTPTAIFNFIRAFTMSVIYTKFFGLYYTLRSTARHRVKSKKREQTWSEEHLQSTMQIFRHIRTFFYTAKNQCYFDCSVLTRFLKYHGYDAKWVFGVKTDPFEAHCWVQVEGVVMSDWQLNIYRFTPILLV